MKRTLKNIIATSVVIGGLLFTGCVEKKIKEAINYPAKTITGEEDAYTQAKIELKNYFFKGKELEFVSPSEGYMEYGKNSGWWISQKGKNLEIITGEELKRNGEGSNIYDTLGELLNFIGQGEYSLPSGEKMMLTIFKYKSSDIAKQTANNIAVNLNFLKEDLLVWVSTPELWEYLQPNASLEKDRKVFLRAISHYLDRTKMELVFSNLAIKQQISDLLLEYSDK